MNNIKTHMLARPLGYVLAVLVALTSSYLTLGLSRVARAQSTSNTVLWAVLDFNNNTGYGGSEVGRVASDAFNVEIANTTLNDGRKIQPYTRAEIASSVSRLGLQYPLDVVDVQRLGRDLDARAVVSGDVLSITRNEQHQVQVVMAIRVTDVASGEVINGALAEGTSTLRNGTPDEDAYVSEAIRKAAFAAVERIKRFNLPIATVLNYQGTDEVLINKGARDGYFIGLNMVVLRNGAEVGRLRVASLDQDDAYAVIQDRGTGIRPQDRCHALFAMPAYTVRNGQVITTDKIMEGEGAPSRKRSNFTGVGGIILAVLATAFLIYIVNRGASVANLGGGTVGAVLAQACNNFGDQTITGTNNNGVRVAWNNGNINPVSIFEWNIYRDNHSPVGGIGSGSGTSSTSTTTTGTVFADGPEIVAPQGTYSVIDDAQQRTVNFVYVVSNGSSGGNSSTGTTSSSSGTTTSLPVGSLGNGINVVAGVALNQVHNYEVTAVYHQQDIISGTMGYVETPISVGVAKGYATPLYPVDVTASAATQVTLTTGGTPENAYNATGVNLSSVKLTWPTVIPAGVTNAGALQNNADDYVVDFSTTPTFTKKYTAGIGQNANVVNTTCFTDTLNLRSFFGLNGTTQTVIYYRIGLRHSTDVPGPYYDTRHINNPDRNPQGGSYLYPAATAFFQGT